MEYYSVIKKNEIMPLAATWMQLEITILAKSKREIQIPYDVTSIWSLNYDARELTYEIDKRLIDRGQTCYQGRGK